MPASVAEIKKGLTLYIVNGCFFVSVNNIKEFILIKVELFHMKLGTRNGYKIVSIYFDGVIPMVLVIKPYRYRSFNVLLSHSHIEKVHFYGFKATKSKCYDIF